MTNTSIRVGFVLILTIGGACSVWGAPSDSQLIQWLVGGPSTPFQTKQKVTLRNDGRDVSSEVLVSGDGKGAIRREYTMSGKKSVVLLRIGAESWQHSDGAWIDVADGEGLSISEAVQRVRKNYNLSQKTTGTLKGRSAIGFEIRAKTPGNPHRSVWMDAQNGVLLSERIFAPDGTLRSSTDVLSISTTQPNSRLFAKPSGAKSATTYGPTSFRGVASKAEMERLTRRDAPLPDFVPSGFSVARYGIVTSANARHLPAIRYSDGLSTFTVFQRFGGGGGPGNGQRGGFGPGGRFGRGRGGQGGQAGPGGGQGLRSNEQRSVVNHRSRTANYLLMGDLSEELLQKVADSLP